MSVWQLKRLRWLDLKDNPLSPALAKVAGDCADAKQCQAAASRVPPNPPLPPTLLAMDALPLSLKACPSSWRLRLASKDLDRALMAFGWAPDGEVHERCGGWPGAGAPETPRR